MNKKENDKLSRFSIVVVDTYDQFKKLKKDWQEIYTADDYATFYISWIWFSRWLKITPSSWFILAVWDEVSSSFAGFLPFEIRQAEIKKLQPVRVLKTGGDPLSFISGIIYRSEFETEITNVLFEYIKSNLHWDKFQLKNMHPHHVKLFNYHFSNKDFTVDALPGMPSSTLTLPISWDDYLKNNLGQQTRKTLKRLSNKINADTNITMTRVNEETVDRDIDVVINLWQARYGAKRTALYEKKMFRHYFDRGKLWLNIYWDGSKPISAQACILDTPKQTCYAAMTGYDSDYAHLSPGNVIGLVTIRQAIEQGFKYYSFILGDNKYKIRLGAKFETRSGMLITRKSIRSYLAIKTGAVLTQIKKPLKKTRK